MSIDYSALLYDPVYLELGVPAVFTASGGSGINVVVIDDTRPKALPSGSLEVKSVGPGAYVRIPELNALGIMRGDYLDAVLNFNGRNWAVRSYELRGSPNGEDFGEVRFLLKEAVVSGGGIAPDWVPANAKFHIDFLGGTPQGRAWNNGAEVAIDTLLGSDPNTENGWGVTGYDSDDLTVDGLIPSSPSGSVAFIGEALTKILDALTIRFQVKQTTTNDLSTTFALLSADGADAINVDASNAMRQLHIYSWNGSLEIQQQDVINVGVDAINAVAATITDDRFDGATNGFTAISGVIDETDRPPGNPLVAAILQGGVDIAIQSITLYDPLPDTTGLSELSQVG